MKNIPRYDTSSLPEAQFEPGSRCRVLKNRPGIKSKRKMDEAESIALKAAIDKLIGKKKKDYISAVQAGLERDYKPMEKIFKSVIRKTLRTRGRQ